MGSLPSFDTTKPDDPLFGPLSMWLVGDNPFDPEDRPETFEGLAEALGVSEQKLRQKRISRRFRDFHNEAVGGLGEILAKRQQIIERAYEMGMAGNAGAMALFLKATANAEAFARAGQQLPSTMSPEDAAKLSDEEIATFMAANSGPES